MTDYEMLQAVSSADCSSVRAMLEVLESRVPAVRIFETGDETVVAFPLPGGRRHSVSLRDCRTGDGPRVWLLSSRAGMLEPLAATGFTVEDYNSQADLGLATNHDGVVVLQTQLIKAHSSPILVAMTAYSLARQADALEKRVSDKDEL